MSTTRITHSKPAFKVPSGATDCHIHVFGSLGEYRLVEDRNYTPPPASLASYTAICDVVGLDRVVLVQPSVYGFDNSAILDAIAAHGLHRARGVGAVPPTVTDQALGQLRDAGIVGVRVFIANADDASILHAERDLRQLAERIAAFGMHVQLLSWAPILARLKPLLSQLGVPVVIDHMGRPSSAAGVDDLAFKEVVSLAQLPHVWVKLSAPYRISEEQSGYLPFLRGFLERDTERLVWGSDWPHPHWNHTVPPAVKPDEYTRGVFRQEDFGNLLNTLEIAGAGEALRERILVQNPAKLYGFSPTAC